MTTRSEREKAQKLNEQHQVILSQLLREEANKHCADCEAKGPRWASWNLGVFMLYRCAGIHRNLGVHISRVKSVNLDQWTPEQIQYTHSMVDMSNRRAKLLYEAHLPETFKRSQTDQYPSCPLVRVVIILLSLKSISRLDSSWKQQIAEAALEEQPPQAVEVFIRDKYERKKYYDKEALAAATVSVTRSSFYMFVLASQSM
ncbi:hypothetical protein KUCAC02_024376 [Chaenocephalus aceratus]|uniref:Uncharacterized protein n=1 Tax=Chaenocephalus aceratus TaxID=36190 RepID=A0ACB9WHQ6_CHAAC|nr:hypothetical protein KUCAC02_024376 [Chaenocephalus aceratus]